MKTSKQDELRQVIHAKSLRKLQAKREEPQGIWKGLGMMGLIGWSVTVPTILGAGIGFWLDSRFAGSFSWTLTMLLLGLVLGCANAWHWVRKEGEEMKEEDTND